MAQTLKTFNFYFVAENNQFILGADTADDQQIEWTLKQHELLPRFKEVIQIHVPKVVADTVGRLPNQLRSRFPQLRAKPLTSGRKMQNRNWDKFQIILIVVANPDGNVVDWRITVNSENRDCSYNNILKTVENMSSDIFNTASFKI